MKLPLFFFFLSLFDILLSDFALTITGNALRDDMFCLLPDASVNKA